MEQNSDGHSPHKTAQQPPHPPEGSDGPLLVTGLKVSNRLTSRERRVVFAIVMVAGFGELGYNLVNISAMPMLVPAIGLGGRWIAWFLSIFMLTEAILKSPMGIIGDRIGRKALIVAAPLISCLTSILTVHLVNPYMLVGLRVLDGIAAAALWPSTFSLIADHVAIDRRGAAMSYFNMAYLVGIATGPAIGGYLDHRFHSVVASFYAVAIVFAVMVPVALLLLPGGKPIHLHETGESVRFRDSLKIGKAYPLLLGTIFLVFVGIGLCAPFIKRYCMIHFSLNESQFGNLLIAPALIIAALSAPVGALGDRIGQARAVRIGLAMCAAAFWLLLLGRVPASLVVMGTVVGLGFVLAFPSFMAIVTSVCDSKNRGAMVGTAGAVQGLGAIFGTLIAGRLWEFRYRGSLLLAGHQFAIHVNGHKLPFVGCAALLTLAALAALVPAVLNPKRANLTS